YRTFLGVPLVRDGACLGVINLWRRTVAPFSDQHIELLKTFADQAVIAIENVRLFTELQTRNQDLTEALEQQTATSEILRVISGSPTDLSPVLDAIVRNASTLCEAVDVSVFTIDDDRLKLAADLGRYRTMKIGQTYALTRGWVSGRSVIDRQTVHVHDLIAELTEFPDSRRLMDGQPEPYGSVLATPLVRESSVIGVITIRRTTVRPFSANKIEVLKTFADQAVIAIENVRLFNELQERNRDLTEALERQTATAEILQVISSSPTEIQPVLDAVAQSAMRLCAAYDAVIFRLEGNVLRVVAHHGTIPFSSGQIAGRETLPGRAMLEGRTIHVADLQAEREEFPVSSAVALELGFRTAVNVPLLREGVAIGTIMLRRTEVQPFTDSQLALLKTFADQAVIAIENVRLFR